MMLAVFSNINCKKGRTGHVIKKIWETGSTN